MSAVEGAGAEIGGGITGFIREAIGTGRSARGALADFRELGGHIRDSRWYRLYGEERAALAQAETLASFDHGLLPRDEMFTDIEGGKRGQFGTLVAVFQRFAGSDEVYTNFAWYTSDVIHTPEEAELGMSDLFDVNTEEGGSGEGFHVLGATAVKLVRFMGVNRG